jgi:hypothetical protein
MPALFAYLLAIGILVGGGYAGLRWLTNPPDPGPTIHRAASQHVRVPLTGNIRPNSTTQSSETPRPTSAEKESSWANADGAEGSIQTAHGTKSRGSQAIAPQIDKSEAPKAREAQARMNDADAPRGGCTAIGLTAQGELVFPMECRTYLAVHRDPGSSPGRSDAMHQTGGTEQWSVSSDRQRPQLESLDKQAVTVRPDSASLLNAQQKIPDPALSPKSDKVRRARPAAKKPDGTLKEHPEWPMNPSRTVVSQLDEWFNAFGLR